jgi:hypothetical protein
MNRTLLLSAMAISGFAFAQDPNGGWKRIGDSSPSRPSDSTPNPTYNPAQSQTDAPPAGMPQDSPSMQRQAPPPIPLLLTIKPGTYVTVRVNQVLSSDHNQAGDAFAATLVKPVVVDGIVVAERGQTLGGRVSEAQKAGRVQGVARLGVELTDLPIADGQQLPIKTQLVSRAGPTSVGRDAGAITATTVTGTIIGAGIEGAGGAAVGAGAGLVAGVVGVLLTRGHPSVIYPEQVLTFRVEQPITIATDHAPYSFRYVDPRDYQQTAQPRMQTRGPGPGYGAPPPPPYYYAPYGYGPYGYPYYGGFYGPSVVFGFGGRYGYGHRW